MVLKKRFNVLDGFRGLCALFVVLFHLRLPGSITELSFFRSSDLFVEFFFVLSGFVIAHGYAFKAKLSFKEFFIARTFRLLPLHLFMLLVFIVLEVGKLFASNYGFNFNLEPFTGKTDLVEIIPNLLLLQSWTGFTEAFSYNYVSWSISVEYYMYMIFFFFLFFIGKTRYTIWFLTSTFMFSIILTSNELVTEFVARGLSCFFAGSLVYIFYKKINESVKFGKSIFSIVELLVIIAIIWIVSSDIYAKTVIASFVFCLCVFIFSFERGIISNLINNILFVYLGKLSYSIYMVHSAVLFCLISMMLVLQQVLDLNLAPMIRGIRFIDTGSVLGNNFVIFTVLAFVIMLSNFTYNYVEVIWQKKGKKIIDLLRDEKKQSSYHQRNALLEHKFKR